MKSGVRLYHSLEDFVVFALTQRVQPLPTSIEKQEHRPDAMPEILELVFAHRSQPRT
jgi:hypothetical protein